MDAPFPRLLTETLRRLTALRRWVGRDAEQSTVPLAGNDLAQAWRAVGSTRTVTRFTAAAVTGLGLLGMTTTGVWLAGRIMHAEASLGAVEISVAGRQRILVERLVEIAGQIGRDAETTSRLKPEMAACADLLMRSHVALTTRNGTALRRAADEGLRCSAGADPWSPADRRQRRASNEALDAVIRRFAAAALIISESAQSQSTRNWSEELVAIGTGPLPALLDGAVRQLQEASDVRASRWIHNSDIALLAVYAGLVGVWLMLFRPMAKATTAAFTDLAHLNALMAERSAELEATNRKLVETADRFRSLSELSADWTWRLSPDLKFDDVSEGATRYGLRPADLIGLPIRDFIDPDSREALRELSEALAHQRPFRSIEYTVAAAFSGETPLWHSISGEPILSPDGSLLGYRGVCRDITRRRQAMRSLDVTTAKLQAFIETAPIAIAMFDRDMRYIAHTRKWLELYGLEDQDLLGRSHYDVLPHISEAYKAVHQRCLKGAIERVPEEPTIGRNGSSMIIRREVRPWYDEQGEIGGLVILNDDVTSAARTMKALQNSEDRLRLLFDLAPVGLCVSEGRTGQITMASRALSQMSGYAPEQLRAMSLATLVPGRPAMDRQDGKPIEVTIRTSTGEPAPAIYSELTFLDENGREMRLATLQDISWRKEHEDNLWQAAHVDPLTGLANRRLLTSRLELALAENPASVALCIVDIDDFKAINDTIGHTGGDAYLKAIAARLSDQLSDKEMVARIGADEFGVVLTCTGSDADLTARIVRLRDALVAPFVFDGISHPSSASIGSAIGLRDGASAEALMTSADIAVNTAKVTRGSYVAFQPIYREALQKRVRVRSEILAAIEKNEMEMFYQPIVRLRTRQHAGFEALIRWRHPTLGVIGPGAFLDAFEDPKSAAAVGQFVVEHTFSQVAEWQRAGRAAGKVAINLSTADFRSGSIVARFDDAVKRYGLSPSAIGLEITENVFLGQGSDEIERDLRRLRAMGFEIAFDDFGTGYASLTHVRRFPIDRIKIDRSFVATLTSSEGDRAIVCAMIGMAHGLGLRVTAEGVDQEATMELLGRLGCHEVQGYAIGRPMPASETLAYFDREAETSRRISERQ